MVTTEYFSNEKENCCFILAVIKEAVYCSLGNLHPPSRAVKCFSCVLENDEIVQLMRQKNFSRDLSLARLQGEKSLTFFTWKSLCFFLSFPSPSTCVPYFFYDHDRKVCTIQFLHLFSGSFSRFKREMKPGGKVVGKTLHDPIREVCVFGWWKFMKKANPCCEKKNLLSRKDGEKKCLRSLESDLSLPAQ